jgi:serine/threonine-protein kinase RsbW
VVVGWTLEMPGTTDAWLELQYPATSGAVPAIRHAVTALAARLGADADRRDRIALAVTEACSNVTLHAYRNQAELGEIEVRAGGDDDRFDVVVTDSGGGMRPRRDSPGLGLGVPLMSQLADEIEFRVPPSEHGTELHLRFSLAGRDAAATAV